MKSAKEKTRRFWPLVASAALLLVLLAQPARRTGTGLDPNPIPCGPMPTTGALRGPGHPGAGETVFLTSTTNKTAFYDTTLNPSLNVLTVDASGGSTFTLTQTGNTLSVAFTEIIGLTGKGQVVQTGGTNTKRAILSLV